MGRTAFLCLAVLLFSAGVVMLSLNGCGGVGSSQPPPPPTGQKIQHVVIIFQENRTPDNLFQDPVLYNPPPAGHGADIVQSGWNSQGQQVPLGPIDLGTNGANPDNYDLGHGHYAFGVMYDNGKMDGADKVEVTCAPGASGCPPPTPQFKYVSPSDVQPYFALAEQYTFADRMFQTNQGPSFPAHQFILSGT